LTPRYYAKPSAQLNAEAYNSGRRVRVNEAKVWTCVDTRPVSPSCERMAFVHILLTVEIGIITISCKYLVTVRVCLSVRPYYMHDVLREDLANEKIFVVINIFLFFNFLNLVIYFLKINNFKSEINFSVQSYYFSNERVLLMTSIHLFIIKSFPNTRFTN